MSTWPITTTITIHLIIKHVILVIRRRRRRRRRRICLGIFHVSKTSPQKERERGRERERERELKLANLSYYLSYECFVRSFKCY